MHRVNSWDGKFVRNYNKIISRSEPYVAVGVPVAMAVAAWIKHDKGLLKDAVYVGTSVAGAFVVTYGMKYLVDRERPYDKYPDRVHAYSHEGSPSFPSGHTATAFALATSLSVKYPKWYVIAPSACGLFRGSFPYERGSALSVRCVGGGCNRCWMCCGQHLRQQVAE